MVTLTDYKRQQNEEYVNALAHLAVAMNKIVDTPFFVTVWHLLLELGVLDRSSPPKTVDEINTQICQGSYDFNNLELLPTSNGQVLKFVLVSNNYIEHYPSTNHPL